MLLPSIKHDQMEGARLAIRTEGRERARGQQSRQTASRWTPESVADVVAGDRVAAAELVSEMGRVIRARVYRRVRQSGIQTTLGECRFDVEDLCQEVFTRLFERDGRVLRSWDPKRGLSLANFVGLVAERHVGGLLRVRRIHLETATDNETLESMQDPAQERRTESDAAEHRQLLETLGRALASRLSARGMAIYQLLFIEGRSVEDIEARLALKASAIYAWRQRIRKHLAVVGAQLDIIHDTRWAESNVGAARAA
jgi:RNA polymerase sigma factor (sigma-70 family)